MRLAIIGSCLILLVALVGCSKPLPMEGVLGDTLQAGMVVVKAISIEEVSYDTVFSRVPEEDQEAFQTSSLLKPEHTIYLVDVEYTNKDIQPIKVQQDQWRLIMTDAAFAAYEAEQRRMIEEAMAAEEAEKAEGEAEAEAEKPEGEEEAADEPEEPAEEEEPIEVPNLLSKAGGDFLVFQYYPEAREQVDPTVRVGADVTKGARICMVTVPSDVSRSDMVLVFEDRLTGEEVKFTLQ
jgi:hypothetical protein